MDMNQLKQQLQNNHDYFIGEAEAFKAAVLIPLIKKEDGWHILFEVRSAHLKSQPGDVCFPGGRVDDTDPSFEATAIRETCEELGIPESSIEIAGALAPFIPSTSFVVYPFVGVIDEGAELALNEAEVEETFTIPLDWLESHEPEKHLVGFTPEPPADFPYDKIAGGKDYEFRSRSIAEWFYHYGEKSVWGMTARILKYFLGLAE